MAQVYWARKNWEIDKQVELLAGDEGCESVV